MVHIIGSIPCGCNAFDTTAWYWSYYTRCISISWLFSLWPFSAVCFQMCPQMTCLKRGIITLVAFVQLFPFVHFKMYLQINCPIGCIVTLVACLPPRGPGLVSENYVALFPEIQFNKCNQCDYTTSHTDNLTQIEDTFENAHWRKVEQMQPMWLCIFPCRWFEETFENTKWRKVKQMQPM